MNLEFTVTVTEHNGRYSDIFDKVLKKGEWIQWRVHNKDNHLKYENNILIVHPGGFNEKIMRTIFENIVESMDVALFGKEPEEIL